MSESDPVNAQDAVDEAEIQSLTPSEDRVPQSEGFADTILETELNDASLEMVQNLITEEWVKANLTDAEVHEQKWLARVAQLEIEAMHPHQRSLWSGTTRSYARGESSDQLQPLSDSQRATLEQLILAHITRLTRSREMSQQEIFRTMINRNEREDLSDDDDGGWLP